jgi:hypothetical protein
VTEEGVLNEKQLKECFDLKFEKHRQITEKLTKLGK